MRSVMRTLSTAAKVGRFLWGHKRLTLALPVGLLIVAPLSTGSGGGTFFLNPVGLGIAALVVWRIARPGKGRQAGCRCNCRRQNANTQQQGGTP